MARYDTLVTTKVDYDYIAKLLDTHRLHDHGIALGSVGHVKTDRQGEWTHGEEINIFANFTTARLCV